MQTSIRKKKRVKYIAGLLLVCGLLLLGKKQVFAESGSIYTCSITTSYTHPVTGVIEDSGGEASAATGQGMAESVVGTQGILEVTDSGKYYLTVRFSLMDYASGHDISAQNVGDSTWSSTSVTTTATGADGSGSTEDACIEVPSESCIVRCSMYVEPMGRNVIFYFYPGDYQSGNQTDFKAINVTETSNVSDGAQENKSEQSDTDKLDESSRETMKSEENDSAKTSDSADAKSSDNAVQTSETVNTESENKAAAPQADTEVQGLALSTASEISNTEQAGSDAVDTSAMTPGKWILVLTVSMTLSGLILMAAGTGIFLFLQKHGELWKGDEDDE